MRFAKPTYNGTSFEINCLVYGEGYTLADAERLVLFGQLMRAVVERKCKREGHRFDDHSSAGPDCGNVHVSCTRCGFAHHFQLY